MQVYSGDTVQAGAAYGFIVAMNYFEQQDKISYADSAEREKQEDADPLVRLFRSRVYVDSELMRLEESTKAHIGEKESEIFSACRVLLKDETLTARIIGLVREDGYAPEQAITKAFDELADMLKRNQSEYFNSRYEDVIDLRDMLVHALSTNCKHKGQRNIKDNCILVADSLTAAQLMRYDIRKVKGIVCRKGSLYSHAAILAKAKNIPMIVGCNIPSDIAIAGFPAVLFAEEGRFFINPTEEVSHEYKTLKYKHATLASDIASMKEKGINPLGLYANAFSIAGVRNAKKAGMLGVGLFRSEFIYLEENVPPSEEKQFLVYSESAKILKGAPLIIRTADFDDDKTPSYFKNIGELRGIRYSLAEGAMLRVQLRALLRAAMYGNIGILLPMVKSPDEVDDVLNLLEDIKRELAVEGRPFAKNIPVGVMVETPEAVECVDSLAEMASFFSIGTNDLSRYALGIDRNSMSLTDLSGDNKDKLLALVEKTTKSAHAHGLKAMVCGELGSDPKWHYDLLNAGVDGFSVTV